MIHYNPDLERFVDGVDFGPNDPCTWIVYPPGCAGDLLASIVNFHYVETGARFKGISNKGQVIFTGSDQKHTNKLWQANQLKFDEQYFYDLADILSLTTHWSRMDCLLFSAHLYQDHHIQMILDTFKNCKIIRFLPRTHGDRTITEWLAEFKNSVPDVIPEFVIPDNHHMEITYANTISDSRLLTVFFKDVINSAKFKSTYQLIQTHLGFPGPLITYDFIQFWIDQQPSQIQSYIKSIAGCD